MFNPTHGVDESIPDEHAVVHFNLATPPLTDNIWIILLALYSSSFVANDRVDMPITRNKLFEIVNSFPYAFNSVTLRTHTVWPESFWVDCCTFNIRNLLDCVTVDGVPKDCVNITDPIHGRKEGCPDPQPYVVGDFASLFAS